MTKFQGIQKRADHIIIFYSGQKFTIDAKDDRGNEKNPSVIRGEIESKHGSSVEVNIELHKTPSGRVIVGWQGSDSPDYGRAFNWAEVDKGLR